MHLSSIYTRNTTSAYCKFDSMCNNKRCIRIHRSTYDGSTPATEDDSLNGESSEFENDWESDEGPILEESSDEEEKEVPYLETNVL